MLLKNIIILMTSAHFIPALADWNGIVFMVHLAQGQAWARHFTNVVSLTINPFLSHSHLNWFYYLMFLSFFSSTGKWALLYVLSPITRFVTCHLLVLLVSKDITFSTNRYLLKWNSFLLFRSREPFVPHLSGIFLLTVYFLAHKQSDNGRPFWTAHLF